jgi:hypothetical protein
VRRDRRDVEMETGTGYGPGQGTCEDTNWCLEDLYPYRSDVTKDTLHFYEYSLSQAP